ncbi:MAG: adenosylhomocysteinase [Chloroflexi bacterium]|nr:adenosylhomocysteinase [Chloroflexota bacterium]|tara:strand:- start:188 stop:1459 length:1272 start_codon:yes stop_codon:yes gene_type:complete
MVTGSHQSDIADSSLAGFGVKRIEWADLSMPVLATIRDRFSRERPLDGIRISACLHVTAETANLMRTLQAGGAEVLLCASNPLSTQDDVAAALVQEYGAATFAINGEDSDVYYSHIESVLDAKPHLTTDDGADLVSMLHSKRTDVIDGVLGGTEETTTGVIRLKAMAAEGVLKYPIVAVNEAMTKHMFDNRYGTGQSTLDGIVRATNILLAGRTVVVGGYGWCGRGLASRADGMGAQVVVTEVDPVRALEAVMDGYRVMPMLEAAAIGDMFITVTGDKHVIDRHHIEVMKDGAILANSGHFDIEINLAELESMATGVDKARPFVDAYDLSDGRRIFVLAQGRLVNLAAGEGHPASVMDMSFANQALALEHLAKNASSMPPAVYDVSGDIDRDVAGLKLQAMGVGIDSLTDEQQAYLEGWHEGT